jgi:hypothetical protein
MPVGLEVDMVTDHQNPGILEADDILDPSTTICLCIHFDLCCVLVLGSVHGALLAHCRYSGCLHRRHRHRHHHVQSWCEILWYFPDGLWTFCWSERKSACHQISSSSTNNRKIHIPWETTNVPRPRTKRAALLAITNCISSVSHWFSPYFFVSGSTFTCSDVQLTACPAYLTRATVSNGRRSHHLWLWNGYRGLSCLPMVFHATEQEACRGRRAE